MKRIETAETSIELLERVLAEKQNIFLNLLSHRKEQVDLGSNQGESFKEWEQMLNEGLTLREVKASMDKKSKHLPSLTYAQKSSNLNPNPLPDLDTLINSSERICVKLKPYVARASRVSSRRLRDLSHFYVSQEEGFEGELDRVSQQAANAILSHQPLDNYSLFSLFIYLEGLADVLFSDFPASNKTKVAAINMLRRDFKILVWQYISEILLEREQSWSASSGFKKAFSKLKVSVLGSVLRGGKFVQSPQVSRQAFDDCIMEILKIPREDLNHESEVVMQSYLVSLKQFTAEQDIGRISFALSGFSENTSFLQFPDLTSGLSGEQSPDWEDVNFNRGVSSAMSTIRDGETGPVVFYMFIEPAPLQNYVAAIGLFIHFTEEHSKDLKIEQVTTYSSPFSLSGEVQNRAAVNFYVTKEGELVSYGHSAQIVKNTVGGEKAYQAIKQLVQRELSHFVHAEYMQNSEKDPNASGKPMPDIQGPAKGNRRLGRQPSSGESVRDFNGFPPHARILPKGYRPGPQAYKRAKDQKAVKLHAYTFADEACLTTPTQEIDLDVSLDYFTFLDRLEQIASEYKEQGFFVRFQTYVRAADKKKK